MTELAPCPCCGGEPLISAVRGWTIQCANCYLWTGHYRIEADAFAAWNRRAPDMAAEIAALRAVSRAAQAVVEAATEANGGKEIERVARGSNLGRYETLVPWSVDMPTETLEKLQTALARALLAGKEEK